MALTFQDNTRKAISNGMLSSILMRVSITALLLFCVSPPVRSQQQKREILSDDFTKNRRQAAQEEVRSKGAVGQSSNRIQFKPRTNRTYRLASSTITTARPARHRVALAQLGITIWRLRPVTVNDTGARVATRENSTSTEWVAERVEANTRFREGDLVRLSIESPKTGYLYVVNRDLFADGTSGRAMLIYPWADGRDNLVRPGKLIDIPAQEDDPSYFTARPTRPNQTGELLTIIVTRSPLDLPTSDKPVQIPNLQMAKWEKMWTGQSERFEMEGGAGETWTKQEQQAAVRKGMRQLTREDPAPQTIYRVTTSNKIAFLVNVHLAYR